MGQADGVFKAKLSAADLHAYRTRFPAGLDADSFNIE
ncbi:Nitrilase/cyanide hydratase and apolipoprotein N-acyltransferase [Pseudomonas amygdali pv. ulmi]|uniref:Nitrilase/cyanide hydratase and apolipoprotein N-acyltransferase n=1 Tax=Pseudomonas amygdali pv. ulmi TaxID=251720 RepID=A0A3M4T8G9_PSEA0|nr:Nitrilase/cyanide hydratase and apolipoprotein N-acyltransferase [Pseudomonas amygdali pv. ulmi]